MRRRWKRNAEHRASGHGRIPRSVHSAVGGGVGDGDADACRVGSVRPVAEGQEDVEQGLEIAARPGREDREDEGRPDALGVQGRARGRHGHGGHRVGDGAGCLRGRYGDAAGDADHGGRAGGVGAAGWSGGRRGGGRQGVPQRRDAGGARRGWGSESRIGAGARPALLARQEDGRDGSRRRCMPTAVALRRGRRLQRCRGEVVERTFAHMYRGACVACGCAVTRMFASGC